MSRDTFIFMLMCMPPLTLYIFTKVFSWKRQSSFMFADHIHVVVIVIL
jgi:hypothetical protein